MNRAIIGAGATGRSAAYLAQLNSLQSMGAVVLILALTQPIPPVKHSHHLTDIRTPLSGLYFASMSQVYPWDRGTNYAVDLGRRTVRIMVQETSDRVER